jgi:hypothetical protein
MGVDAAARTHIPATQDSSNTVTISRRCNLQSDPKSDFGQVQTRKVTPEALALLPFQQDPITNKRETYTLQNQTAAVAPEALANFFGSDGSHAYLCWATPSDRTQSRGNAGGYVQLSPNNISLAQ